MHICLRSSLWIWRKRLEENTKTRFSYPRRWCGTIGDGEEGAEKRRVVFFTVDVRNLTEDPEVHGDNWVCPSLFLSLAFSLELFQFF